MTQWRSLQEYCDWLNSLHWVRASGKPYFISKMEDGTEYLNRAA